MLWAKRKCSPCVIWFISICDVGIRGPTCTESSSSGYGAWSQWIHELLKCNTSGQGQYIRVENDGSLSLFEKQIRLCLDSMLLRIALAHPDEICQLLHNHWTLWFGQRQCSDARRCRKSNFVIEQKKARKFRNTHHPGSRYIHFSELESLRKVGNLKKKYLLNVKEQYPVYDRRHFRYNLKECLSDPHP